ncbi:MAG: type II toxin-antitoxin system VapC family toxin [Acidobacteria bacterium]|nr:type II toxin-antitoxin system VapC family toxin [Acidobacteriota bacterium]
MIAVDTNVLVRLVVADDLAQAALARSLIEEAIGDGTTCYVSTPVLCELEWVLVSRYRVPRTEIAAVLKRLLDNAVFTFEDRNVLLQALAAYRQSRAGFADHLMGAKAQAFGATTTWTFDRALRRCTGFSILG